MRLGDVGSRKPPGSRAGRHPADLCTPLWHLLRTLPNYQLCHTRFTRAGSEVCSEVRRGETERCVDAVYYTPGTRESEFELPSLRAMSKSLEATKIIHRLRRLHRFGTYNLRNLRNLWIDTPGLIAWEPEYAPALLLDI